MHANLNNFIVLSEFKLMYFNSIFRIKPSKEGHICHGIMHCKTEQNTSYALLVDSWRSNHLDIALCVQKPYPCKDLLVTATILKGFRGF